MPVRPLAVSLFFLSTVSSAVWASQLPGGYIEANKVFHLRAPLAISATGKVAADKALWTTHTDDDGTDVLTATSGQAKAAVMKAADGGLESITAFELSGKAEESASVFFSKSHIAAITTCAETITPESIGRVCVTATPGLCQGLREANGVTPATIKEMESFEMRALASILTLRGADHQLDNMAKSGNRLGLKTALQTTKGQLIALAHQVAKEQGRLPASEKPQDAAEEKRAKEDNVVAKAVLEANLPRLKESCRNANF